MRRGSGWGKRFLGGLAALALLTHCGAEDSGTPDGETPPPEAQRPGLPPSDGTPPDVQPPAEQPPGTPPPSTPPPSTPPPSTPPPHSEPGLARWARQFGGKGTERLHAMATDAKGGFVSAGLFGDDAFPMGRGVALARYKADGTPLWTRQVTTEDVRAKAIAVTPEGNILLVGSYSGMPDLGGGPLSRSPGAGPYGFFIAKFSPSGEHVWSRGFVATSTYNEDGELLFYPVIPEAVATDANGSLVVVGNFQGDVDFGGGVLSAGSASVYGEDPYPGGFIAKFNWQGGHVWSRATEARPSEPASRLRTVSTDENGRVLVGGRVAAGSHLGDGVTVSRSAAFIARYDATRGTLQWRRLFTGTSVVYGEVTGVKTLNTGDVAFTANLGGTFSFREKTYIGGEPEDQGYSGNVNGFTGTLNASGSDGWLRDLKRTWLGGIAAAGYTFTVVGEGFDLDLISEAQRSLRATEHTAFAACYLAGGSHGWSRVLDLRFTGDRYEPRVQLAAQPDGGVVFGGDFEAPVRQDGVTYTPRGAFDLFYLRIPPKG